MACNENDSVGDPITCRICFMGASDGEGNDLVSPCNCEGSQKWVHLQCLRRWQRAVQLDASNHPQDAQREERHRICNVCRKEFDIPPQDRASMMSDLACIRPDEIAPGLVLVTKVTGAESALRSAQLNLVLRAYIETKAAHFREAVYVLTSIHEGDGTDGSDCVIGVNLTRTLETPDVSQLEDAVDEEAIAAFRSRGVEVQWMNGGPVKPRVVTALTLVKHLPHARRAEFCARSGTYPVINDHLSNQESIFGGPLLSLLNLAAEELEASKRYEGRPVHTVLAWAGFAQWSRTQLLGELARGSWGWCIGNSEDIHAAISGVPPNGSPLWSSLRYSDRLHWAPENDLSREFERHLQLSTETTPENPDPHAETLDALVQLFEARRRGSEPRAPSSRIRNSTASAGGRSCTQQ